MEFLGSITVTKKTHQSLKKGGKICCRVLTGSISSVKLESLRCIRALTAKKYTGKCDARMFWLLNLLLLLTFPLPSPLYLLTLPDVDSMSQDLRSLFLESSFQIWIFSLLIWRVVYIGLTSRSPLSRGSSLCYLIP